MKGSKYGLKIADDVPNRVPGNWGPDDIDDAIADYRTSIASRKTEYADFELRGTGTEIQRVAHARRIAVEENFLKLLLDAMGN